MSKKKQKFYLNDGIGLLSAVASIASLIALFVGIFFATGWNKLGYPGPFLVAFAICAYIARARFLGYKFSNWINFWMIGLSVIAIILSAWGIISVL